MSISVNTKHQVLKIFRRSEIYVKNFLKKEIAKCVRFYKYKFN